jgi:UDP-N-acetylmuramoyl-L-alanyl-D-glutamate--2,6-diaminopimelate ligase
MRLSTLLSALPPDAAPRNAEGSPVDADPVIRGLAYDSRQVTAGDLFFALPGTEVDGHDYVDQALERGAAAMILERVPSEFDSGRCPAVVVRDSRRALAPISTSFFGNPASELTLIGVTGTNGKTSTSYLIESILVQAGQRVGLIGTVEIRYADERERSVNTTPESLDLQRTLRAMRTRDVETVVMEVSSHGLELGRVDGCRFDVGAVGNVTQDHLDFHGTMEAYRGSKVLLFDRYLERDAIAVVNLDDPSAAEFLAASKRAGARIVRVSREPGSGAEIILRSANVDLDRTRAEITTPLGDLDVELPLVGDFNVENMLVAFGVAAGAGVSLDAIIAGIESCPQVPGRVERIGTEIAGAPTVIVDYAHTPDAVEKLLQTLRPLTDRRLITVFGCGGDRDRSKRPLMAQAVARFSDRIVATSDNPRTEDPERILVDVESGLTGLRRVEPEALREAQGSYASLVDRRRAIELAIEIADAGDMVVIAGKGHEDYQIIGRKKFPFHDCEEARRALERRACR